MSIYRNDDGKQEIEEQYWQLVEELDAGIEQKRIETRFGETHVLLAGDEENPPLVVFHGGNVANPVSLEWFLSLRDRYRIYAPDTVGHPGLSAQTRLSPRNDDYGRWAVDLLDELGLDRVPMIGPSYGGGIVLRTAAYAPERIKGASLIVPAGFGIGSPVRMSREILFPTVAYRLHPSRRRLLRAVRPMFSDPSELDDALLEHIGSVFRHVKLERSFPKRATENELRDFDAPVQLIAAGDDVFFPAERVVPRAREVLPKLVDTVVLERAGHFPSSGERTRLRGYVRAFFNGNR